MKKLVLILLLLSTFLNATPFQKLRQTAVDENKLLWVFIETDNCGYCKKMRKEVIDSGLFQREASQKFIFAPLHDKEAEKEGFDVVFFPTSYIVNPTSKKIIEQFFGYMEADFFISILKRM